MRPVAPRCPRSHFRKKMSLFSNKFYLTWRVFDCNTASDVYLITSHRQITNKSEAQIRRTHETNFTRVFRDIGDESF